MSSKPEFIPPSLRGRDEIKVLSLRITPLVKRGDRVLAYMPQPHDDDLFGSSYPWCADEDFVPVDEVFPYDLRPIGHITTFHSCSFYGFFKPSQGEVLRAIPESVLEKVVAYLVEGPETATDLNDGGLIGNGPPDYKTYHVATTTLFERR